MMYSALDVLGPKLKKVIFECSFHGEIPWGQRKHGINATIYGTLMYSPKGFITDLSVDTRVGNEVRIFSMHAEKKI